MNNEEVLVLDKKLRGKIYVNPRSKNKFFLHCVVQDIDTKVVNVILSNIYKQAMVSVTIERFNEIITLNGKQVRRFILEEKVEESKPVQEVKQTDITNRLHSYDKKEEIKNFTIIKKP
jgi:hypothetical protein